MEKKIELIHSNLKEQIQPNLINEKIDYIHNFQKKIENNEKNQQLKQSQINELLDRKISFDSTSIATSQIDNLSQTTESSLFLSCTNNSNIINQKDLNKNENEKEEEILNYFDGIEKYFLNIMPEKFIDYTKTKNFVPKNGIIKEEEEKIIQNNDEKENIQDKDKPIIDNKFNQNSFQFQNNLYYSPFGNIFYYAYNPFFFNYPFIKVYNKELNHINDYDKKNIEEEIIDKDKDKDNDKNNINNNNSNDEQEVIYIIKKQNKNKNYNKNYYKDKEQKKNNDNEKIILDINRKNNNKNYKYKQNNYKTYNNNKDYNNNHINKTYYKSNKNKPEPIKNYYNSGYYNIKKPRKVIYY